MMKSFKERNEYRPAVCAGMILYCFVVLLKKELDL